MTTQSMPSKAEASVYYDSGWPELVRLLRLLLRPEEQVHTSLSSFSHEELYRIIYQICWLGFRERLYQELVRFFETTLDEQDAQLKSIADPAVWLQSFGTLCVNHLRAVDIIGDLFAYLDKAYVRYTLQKDLKDVLTHVVQERLVATSEELIFATFKLVVANVLPVDEGWMRTVAEALLKMNPDSIFLNPTLFQELIPRLQDLPNIAEIRARHTQLETMYELQQIKSTAGTDMSRAENGLKRDATEAACEGESDAKRTAA
ncbi:CDK2-associated and cullin domain-containing protein 1 [Borealophlyctis nickersoniae]|nr:CDK2-associated and cullin domain-containing protein 1 [Borealophlyctis nickersoniae]